MRCFIVRSLDFCLLDLLPKLHQHLPAQAYISCLPHGGWEALPAGLLSGWILPFSQSCPYTLCQNQWPLCSHMSLYQVAKWPSKPAVLSKCFQTSYLFLIKAHFLMKIPKSLLTTYTLCTLWSKLNLDNYKNCFWWARALDPPLFTFKNQTGLF